MMNPGATPKETTSDNESKSAPMGEWTLSNLAAKPSKKSNNPATKIMSAALTGISWERNKIDRQPESRLQHVMVLGICCLMLISSLFSGLQRYAFFRKAVFLRKI